MAHDRPRGLTRRDLLRSAGAVGAAAAVGATELTGASVVSPVAGAIAQQTAPDAAAGAPLPEPLEHLTASEAELLEAIADHLIPADEDGPGAVEARAVHYIDRALGGALSESHDAYRSGLAAFDRYCRSSRGGAFVDLSATDRLSALIDIETGAATGAGAGFVGSSAAFFGMVRSHVIQGTFGDPYYGGNANFVGWDLIRYPGVRTAVTPQDQTRLESGDLPPYRRSAYDWGTFNKASARRSRPRVGTGTGGDHAD
jgi:gluconate 2-dehydrogenase gamma chain